MTLIDYVCQFCDEPFQRRKRGKEIPKFCSRNCAIAGRPPATIIHGTLRAYQHHGCKCHLCRSANTEHNRQLRQARRNKTPFRHNARTYSNWSCRCETCCAAWKNKMEKERADRRARAENGDQTVPHGTKAGYNWGCRCEQCRAAQKEYQNSPTVRSRRKRYLDSLIDQASRGRYIWTGPELEIASRTDLSHADVARMLHRSYSAVKHKRHALEVDPRAQVLAGVPA